jgi:imidazolonepropionase-like amidohydrolase
MKFAARTWLAELVVMLLALAPLAARAETPLLAVRFGQLVTGRGAVIADAVVVVDGDRIRAVGSGDTAVPEGARVVDVRPLVGMPGLIDAHVHMAFVWGKSPGTTPWTETLSPGEAVFLAQDNARRALEAGITSVRDLGADQGMSFSMRNLIQRGAMIGPRMFVAGCGLHVAGPPGTGPTTDPCRADGVDEVLRAARGQIALGADWIKVYGSTGSADDVTGYQTYGFDELKAAAEVAHRAGKRLAVHSYGPDGARDAVKAGADTIEHAVDLDDATLAEMVKRGTVYVPTVDHNRYYIDHAAEYGYGDKAKADLRAYIAKNFETLRRAVKAQVRIAMGSDAVFSGFGENTRELDWFIKAGMSPAEALDTATVTAASMLGQPGELGVVAPGALADIVATTGSPLVNIEALRSVKWVMVGGKVLIDKR